MGVPVVLLVFLKMEAVPDIKVQLMHEKTPSKEKSYELWIDVSLYCSSPHKVTNHQIQRDEYSTHTIQQLKKGVVNQLKLDFMLYVHAFQKTTKNEDKKREDRNVELTYLFVDFFLARTTI